MAATVPANSVREPTAPASSRRRLGRHRSVYTFSVLKIAESLPWYDFLNRPPLPVAASDSLDFLRRASILVTGAGGSIGSSLALRLAALRPRKLVLLEASENNLYELESRLCSQGASGVTVSCLGSVTDESLLEEIFATHSPKWILHTAAHKHVALLEEHPLAALNNNAVGTFALVRKAHMIGSQVILVSTDKAASPASVMGATKRLAELIVRAHGGTVVRLGNVLGSRGSVVETFIRQAASGDALTLTHPEARRYLLTLEESIELLLLGAIEAFARSQHDQPKSLLLAADLDRTYRVCDLAEFIALRVAPNRKVSFTTSGLRQGEKMVEELWGSDEIAAVDSRNGLRVIESPLVPLPQLEFELMRMEEAILSRDLTSAITILRGLVSFLPSDCLLALLQAAAVQVPA
jgi:FlaA1/EpsC-like NDP-sugar epimerase